MDLDPETVKEIRAILSRDCIVEVTVAFYDNSDDGLEPVDIGATVEFDSGVASAEKRVDFSDMLDSLRDLFSRVCTD